MELNRPNEASDTNKGLTESLLRDALPSYPPHLEKKLSRLLDEVAMASGKAAIAQLTGDHAAFLKEEEAADQFRSVYDYEIERHQRHERDQRIAKKLRRFLPVKLRNVTINLPIGPFPF